MDQALSSNDFFVKTCSLAALATNEKASSLSELRDKIARVHENCLYYHFWGGRLRAQFEDTNYHNDFAKWVYRYLHDVVLAEQLGIIDPTEYNSLEELRQTVLETIDLRLESYDMILWTARENSFHFIQPSTIVFDSNVLIKSPEELPFVIPLLPPSSIFYHFIDSRARTSEKMDDFSIWLKKFDGKYTSLLAAISSIDFYFLSLSQLKEQLAEIFQTFFKVK